MSNLWYKVPGYTAKIVSSLPRPFKQICKDAWNGYINYSSKAVLKVAPLRCNPYAGCEVHSMVCSRDIYRFLLSIKSFLFHFSDVAVVAHDDGTLTGEQKAIISKHIENIKIIDKSAADRQISRLLAAYPACIDYRNTYINAMQVFDCPLLSSTQKTIYLDSDTLFLQKPEKVIEWIHSDNRRILYLREHDPCMQEEILSKLGYKERLNISIAFMCLHNDILDLEFIEKLLIRLKDRQFFNWWTGQNTYAILIIENTKYEAVALDVMEYQDRSTFGFNGGFRYDKALFRHYWNTAYLYDTIYISNVKSMLENMMRYYSS